MIETVDNRFAERPYRVELVHHEFTSICPLTGAPDLAGSVAGKAVDARPETGRLRRPWATITIRYVPGPKLAELKSVRDYLTGFRERQIFQEEVVNEIADELVASVEPQFLEVEGVFNVRGGMTTRAVVRSGRDPT